jgi:hypothetical protein
LGGKGSKQERKVSALTFQEADMDQKKLAIIATKGTLDWAYPPFIRGIDSWRRVVLYETQYSFLRFMVCSCFVKICLSSRSAR